MCFAFLGKGTPQRRNATLAPLRDSTHLPERRPAEIGGDEDFEYFMVFYYYSNYFSSRCWTCNFTVFLWVVIDPDVASLGDQSFAKAHASCEASLLASPPPSAGSEVQGKAPEALVNVTAMSPQEKLRTVAFCELKIG